MVRTWALAALACVALSAADLSADRVFEAIRNDDLALLRQQIAEGAINVRDRKDVTPLMYAAAFGSTEAVKLLLDAGADVNARNAFSATALIWAAGQPRKAQLLVEKRADVNAHSRFGRTALMVAAACDGCSDTVALLLSENADPLALDNGGGSALDEAAGAGDTQSVRLLLAHRAPADAANKGGVTPLMRALYNCNLDAASMLLGAGANVNAASTSGGEVKFGPIQLIRLTPLMVAAPYCPAPVLRNLIEAGAAVNAQDIRGMTPLMLSVGSEHQDPAVVRLLLQAGADVNLKSQAGETARDWAFKYGNHMLGAPSRTPAAAQRPAGPPATAREAVRRATSLLEQSATGFFHQSGCVGCHHQPMTLFAAAAARSAGLRIDEPSDKELIHMIEAEWTSQQEALLERLDPGGLADGEGYELMALAGWHYPPGALTDGTAVHIAALQHKAGNWHVGDASRSPIQEGDIARTARSLRALQAYAPPARKAEFAENIGRARDWLAASKPVTNDDFAMRLAGLAWAGSSHESLAAAGRALIALQRPDGGWAPNRNLSSDAFATGEALWSLEESGVLKPASEAVQHGVRYLLNCQFPDGSWYVRSRAPKFQPYFESGFPFGHDQWISSAATAWAVAAIAPTISERSSSSAAAK